MKVFFSMTGDELRKVNEELGFNLIDFLKNKGVDVRVVEEKSRFLVLNKGAHPVEEAIREQFGDVEVIVLSEGNIGLDDVEKIAFEAARIYSENDVIVLTGPALLSVLTTLLVYTKSPEVLRVAQYDLSSKKYVIREYSHLKLRELLTSKTKV